MSRTKKKKKKTNLQEKNKKLSRGGRREKNTKNYRGWAEITQRLPKSMGTSRWHKKKQKRV